MGLWVECGLVVVERGYSASYTVISFVGNLVNGFPPDASLTSITKSELIRLSMKVSVVVGGLLKSELIRLQRKSVLWRRVC